MNASPHFSLKDLLAEAAARGAASHSRRLSAALAGLRCPRDAWYRALGMTAPDATATTTAAPDLLAQAFGAVLDRLGEETDLDVLTHRNVEIEMGGVTVRGVADAVFVDASGPALVSRLHVVTDDAIWAKAQAAPQDDHRAEANLLAFGLEAPRWSVCYVHAATGEVTEHLGTTDAFAARRDFGLFEEIAYWMRVGLPPPRPVEDFEKDDGAIKLARDHEPCKRCPNVSICWSTNDAIKERTPDVRV